MTAELRVHDPAVPTMFVSGTQALTTLPNNLRVRIVRKIPVD